MRGSRAGAELGDGAVERPACQRRVARRQQRSRFQYLRFADERVARKKQTIYANYRARLFANKAFPKDNGDELLTVLTTEELATLWHLPGTNVSAPLMPRVQAKKGQPPVLLPTR